MGRATRLDPKGDGRRERSCHALRLPARSPRCDVRSTHPAGHRREGGRVGYTRLATLATAYHLHQDPTLCALAQPTIPDAEDFGSGEIAPMLRETPALTGLLRPVRKGEKQDKSTFYGLANGASVRIVGAASDDAFRRYSARFLFADEIDGDGWTPGAKTQGDKLKLFWTRGETYWNRKQVRGSTPLLEETSRVHRLFLQSDQSRYFVRAHSARRSPVISTAGSFCSGAARTRLMGSSGISMKKVG